MTALLILLWLIWAAGAALLVWGFSSTPVEKGGWPRVVFIIVAWPIAWAIGMLHFEIER